MINPHSFSATPTPAEAMTPKLLTIAAIARKEMLTSTSWSATGAPKRRIRPVCLGWKRISRRENENGRPFILVNSKHNTTLTAWASTVASAAPATPSPQTPTSSKSPAPLWHPGPAQGQSM